MEIYEEIYLLFMQIFPLFTYLYILLSLFQVESQFYIIYLYIYKPLKVFFKYLIICCQMMNGTTIRWSGCRRAEDIALPSFLATMNSVSELVETILSRINIADTNELAEAVESWRGASGGAPLPDDPSRQKAWDLPIVERNWENMLRVADQVCRARLLATAQRESGAWLNALPVSSLGTLLDSESFRVAIALRVGADVCIPHSCRCGGRMDSRGLHGLSCRYSAGRFPRYSTMSI